jgi:hypothetical protein
VNVDDLEAEINRLVYELYELTEEEIAIVEGKEPAPNPSLKGGEMKDGEMKGGENG